MRVRLSRLTICFRGDRGKKEGSRVNDALAALLVLCIL